MQPFLSADGKRLYFLSTKKCLNGGVDIFMCECMDGDRSAQVNAV
jgi:hypothetical protein